ncbi:MAG: hypothetical protein ACR2IJ_11590 [Fluviibacter sp.]
MTAGKTALTRMAIESQRSFSCPFGEYITESVASSVGSLGQSKVSRTADSLGSQADQQLIVW